MVPRPENLIASDYGRGLLIKLALVATLVAIAILNRVVLTPRIMREPQAIDVGSLWRSVAVEQWTGLMVFRGGRVARHHSSSPLGSSAKPLTRKPFRQKPSHTPCPAAARSCMSAGEPAPVPGASHDRHR